MRMMLLLSTLSPIIPLTAGWRKRNGYLWYYALVGLCFDAMPYLSKNWFQMGFHWLGNVYLLVEFMMLSIYYRNKVFRSKTLFLFTLATGLTIFIISTSAQENGWRSFNYDATSFLNLFYLLLAMAGFYTLLRDQKTFFLERSSFFWVNVTILIYTSGNFFIFLLRNNIEANDPKFMDLLWARGFLSLNILKNMLLAIALYKKEDH